MLQNAIRVALLIPLLFVGMGAFSHTTAYAQTSPATATGGVTSGESVAIKAPNNSPRYRYWTTNWSFEEINVGTLLGRLRRLGIEIPVDADGDVSLRFSVSIPLNALHNGQAYRFNGTLRSNRLRVEELQLSNFSTDVQYDNGLLALKNLATRWIDLQQPSSQGPSRRHDAAVGSARRSDDLHHRD